ncbi:hypothetical protein K7H22_19565 [Seohaeicola saemankumensis]|uniref:hypothetical protein n=1 Tax=Seohaeicola saemankumensis TaxID=481181 RepID=UPI001E58292D|nr:hypothetical protein [Seohaeicola saemankumensis]MCD1628189.1 hypothetical protein [Seohaeicola saemankumensis]
MDNNIFDTLEVRMPWTLANRAMKRAGLDGSQGWDGARQKYQDVDHADAENFLKDLLRQHALCGEKMTKLYPVKEDVLNELREAIDGLEVAEHAFTDKFPLVLSEAQLGEFNSEPVLVSVERTDDGIGAVYATTIKLTSREEIPISDVFEDPEAIKERYDEVIGLKFQSVQLFNVIWVPHHDGFVEVRTDYPKGMRQELVHEIQSQYKAIANSLLTEPGLDQPIDLFPLIEAMYEDEDEGIVVELSFKTSTASIKNEKMRRTRLCLRKELYHKGGKDALGTKIEPFKVSIRWAFQHDGQDYHPELTLAGTSRGQQTVAGTVTGQLVSGAVIKNCTGNVDYEHVKARLVHHLSSGGDKQPD